MSKWTEVGRVCCKCGVFQEWDNFSSKNAKRHAGKKAKLHQLRQPCCKKCSSRKTRDWATENKDTQRERYLQARYGLSEAQYLKMLESQENSCLICGRLFQDGPFGPNSPVVDHCHTTNRVRGILCNECNRGLGYFHDNPEALQQAASYVQRTNEL